METINPIINFGSPSDAISAMSTWADAFFQGMLPVAEVILGILTAFLVIILLIKLFSWGMSTLHHSISGRSGQWNMYQGNKKIGTGMYVPSGYHTIFKEGHYAGLEKD